MKFMKLGSKPDFFKKDGEKIRYVATELATDIVINIGDVKFYLHKFPLLSRSARLQKLVAATDKGNSGEIYIHDIAGGPAAFEVCAKFCYGMTVTLNAYNVVAARCAAEYLEMHEITEKGNLIYKIEVFLKSSIFRSWKDSIIVLQTTKFLLPYSEELKVVSRCLDSIASKASIDPSVVDWSYTYNRKKLSYENGNDPQWNGLRLNQMVPKDWWIEDLCELHIDLYKQVITTIKAKGGIPADVIGEALSAYTQRRLPGFSKGIIQGGDLIKNRSLVETIVHLLPSERGSASSSFLLKLFKASVLLECNEMEQRELMRMIGQQLEEATVADLLIRAPAGETTLYDVDIVRDLIKEFLTHEQSAVDKEFEKVGSPKFRPDASKVMVAKLIDDYLAEIARDPHLPASKFVGVAEMVSSSPRTSHDGIYRAIDMFLKEHPEISKSERKRICKLMDCKKLSAEACMHAVQNERLPLRVVIQVLFFEQARSTRTDLPGHIKTLLPAMSNGSSRSATTNTDEEWDSVPTAEEIKALRGELTTLQLGTGDGLSMKTNVEKATASKMKGLFMSRILSKLRSGKDRSSEISSSDTSETQSTPSSSRRQSVS